MRWLTQWAVTSAALILIVLAARQFLREKLSARWRYALWGVVLLRLLVPFQVELPANAPAPLLASNLAPEIGEKRSIPVFPQSSRPVAEYNGITFDLMEPGEIKSTETSMGYYQRSQDGETIVRYLDVWSPAQIVGAVWGAGAALMALVLLVSNLRFYGKLKKRRKPLEGAEAPVPVYAAEGLPSPCLFGLFRPAVYVTPEAAEDPDALRHVLAHELTHYAHKDHIWSLLRCLALALHWYDPLVWLAVALSKRDGELACDEGAVARLGEEERIPYGRTLVDMVAQKSRPADLLSCSTAMTGSGKSIQQRVARLVRHPETAKAALFAAIAVVALSVVFVFAERGPAQKENSMLLSYLERTTAIRYCPPIYSNTIYPDPITDEDLLAQAKKALSSFVLLDDDHPQPDLELRETMHESRIVLTFEGGQMNYSLLWQDDYTYLFTGDIFQQGMDLKEEEGETARLLSVSGTCISEVNVIALLSDLAWQQESYIRTAQQAVLDENHAATSRILADAIEDCVSIRFPDGSAPDITDPERLARAKEVLTSGYLIDDMDQSGKGGDNETIELRGKDGQRLSSFLITNRLIRQGLHSLTQDQDLLRSVLLGGAQFQFVLDDGTVTPTDISSVPSIFSPYSSYAALGNFAVADLDGDGTQEVVIETVDVSGVTGYLILRREGDQIYGYPSDGRTLPDDPWYPLSEVLVRAVFP